MTYEADRKAVIACLSIPYFAAAVERRADGALQRLPLVIGGQPWETRPVYAYSREVAHRGVRPGMSLRLVGVLSPQAHFMPAAQSQYDEASSEVVDTLTLFSHLVEPEELWHPFSDPRLVHAAAGRQLPARYFLDLETLPLTESVPFVREIGQTVRTETSLAPAIGLAANRFTAQVAATISHPNRLRSVPAAEQQQFLAERSLAFLPLEKETARRLRLLGLRTLGDLANLPLAALQEQFGVEIKQYYELAQGQGDTPLQPQLPRLQETCRFPFDGPVVNAHVVQAALAQIAGDLARRVQAAGLEGRELSLACETEEDLPWQQTVTFRRPTANRQRLEMALIDLFAQAMFTSGITILLVRLAGLQPATGQQAGLFGAQSGNQKARQTLDNVSARHPECDIFQPVLAHLEHPLPERRFHLERVGGGGADSG